MQKDNIRVLLSGEAGQGLQTLQSLISTVFFEAGYYVFTCQELMSRVRGGNNTILIRAGKENRSAYSRGSDLVLVLNPKSLDRLNGRLSSQTLIIGEKSSIEEEYRKRHNCRFLELKPVLKELGAAIYKNIIIFGVIIEMFGISAEVGQKLLKERFGKKGETVIKKNLMALETGRELAKELGIRIELTKPEKRENYNLMTGTAAVGTGAIAGGCNFISSYPMSPGTGVLNYLASRSREFGIVFDQAEDEIAAINMCLGGWYAGGRAMVTTSGGGLALMTEGISLAGISETPAVIHLAQRPGPGTGLPTRTEQGDLNLALYAGHGDLLRIILAPGSIRQAIEQTQMAFYLADKYQIPVFILTDQYFLDSHISFDHQAIELHEEYAENMIIETEAGYRRYDLEANISERGIPGLGAGYVCVDSDEHDESGRITEDFEMRTQMVNKRMSKLAEAEEDYIAPQLIGNEDYEILVIGWGSNLGLLREAMEEFKKAKVAALHFSQLYPLPLESEGYIKQAKKIIVMENNYNGQFADLLEKSLQTKLPDRILKYNGMPFAVEEIIEILKEESNE